MGCFLGCFGFTGRRRRRRPASKVLPRDHRLGNYEPLDSSAFVNLENTITSSDSQLSADKVRESSSIRIGKKVSFNLNVQTYEPLTNDETRCQLWESDEEWVGEKNVEGDSMSKIGSFPSNHRYQNCRDSYDYEDEIEYTESDLDDEFEYDYDYDDGNQRITQNEFLEPLPERNIINNQMQLPVSTDSESKSNARCRSQYVNSVLNPVENITQWKAVKAKTAAQKHQPNKENIGFQQEAQVPFGLKTSSSLYPFNFAPSHQQSKPLLQEFAVDSSLSNWLASPIQSEPKSSTFSAESIPMKKSVYDDRSCSQQSREDRPIMDFTNVKA